MEQEQDQQKYYQVRDSWDSKGYRLYFGDDRYVFQIDGEINGTVFRTIREAQAYCMRRFGCPAVRVHD